MLSEKDMGPLRKTEKGHKNKNTLEFAESSVNVYGSLWNALSFFLSYFLSFFLSFFFLLFLFGLIPTATRDLQINGL